MKKFTKYQKEFISFIIQYDLNKDEAYCEVFDDKTKFERYGKYEEVIEWYFDNEDLFKHIKKDLEENRKTNEAKKETKKQSRPRLIGNHLYKIIDHYDGEKEHKIHLAKYIGRQEDFECMVCRKGHNAYTFNIFTNEEELRKGENYETWAFGKEHMPEIVEDITKEYK